MIIALVYGLILLTSGNPETPADRERAWHVRNESHLAISGESNVNDFRCEVDRYYEADNLVLYSNPGSNYIFLKNKLIINLMEFDCGKSLITNDFRQTLNAGKNPELIINFLTLERLPDKESNQENLEGMIRVTIGGIAKEVEMMFAFNKRDNEVTYLHGDHHFYFSDFDLTPPSKFMGLINVKNQLKVSFDLILEELP